MSKFNVVVADQRMDHKVVDLESVMEIFFLNALRTFSSDQERTRFAQQWLLPYWEQNRSYFYLLLSGERVVGYLSAAPDTGIFLKHNPQITHVSHRLFSNEHSRFPAHLHINLHPDFTGQGGGDLLVKGLIDRLRSENSKGLHIVTDPQSRNVRFYRRMGLKYEKTDKSGTVEYMFMGIDLSLS